VNVVQARAAGCLFNLALNEVNSDEIRDLDGLKPLIGLLSSGAKDLQSAAAGAIANLAAGSTTSVLCTVVLTWLDESNRMELLALDGVRPLVSLCSQPNIELQRRATAALSNCCQYCM